MNSSAMSSKSLKQFQMKSSFSIVDNKKIETVKLVKHHWSKTAGNYFRDYLKFVGLGRIDRLKNKLW